MEQTKTCRDCGGRMTKGVLADGTYRQQLGWAPSSMVKDWWGMKVIKSKIVQQVHSYRCDRCGLLQSYVPDA